MRVPIRIPIRIQIDLSGLRLRFRLTDQENMACFRNKIDIQREIEIEKETEIETCGSCTGQASRVDHKQRRTREQLSPFGQRARIHHPGHREQEARRYRGERSIDMASSLRQLLPLKRIPAVLGSASSAAATSRRTRRPPDLYDRRREQQQRVQGGAALDSDLSWKWDVSLEAW